MRLKVGYLRIQRQYAGFTIRGLADAAGISKSHLAAIEAGRNNASPKTVKKLADALNVSTMELFETDAESIG